MGGQKRTTTQTYRPDRFISDASRNAVDLGRQYANRPYTPYTGDRVAPLSANEQQGAGLASEAAGRYQGDIDAARTAFEGVETDFRNFDAEGYMNPYIKGALDPAAREVREQGARRRNELGGQLASQGAFGGSRAILAQRESDELTDQGISDIYGEGYARAFESGADRWAADQQRQMDVGSNYLNLAGVGTDIDTANVANLMRTGEVQRIVDQMGKDFDYQQFTEGRDWEGKQAAFLANLLPALSGTYGTEATTKEKTKADTASSLLGAATAAGGLAMMMTGTATPLAAMSSIWGATGGTPTIGSEAQSAMAAGVS